MPLRMIYQNVVYVQKIFQNLIYEVSQTTAQNVVKEDLWLSKWNESLKKQLKKSLLCYENGTNKLFPSKSCNKSTDPSEGECNWDRSNISRTK